MKVCLILEGCYPYIRGGVSSWAHDYILSSPDTEFVLWTIHAARQYTGEPVYELPPNVTENHEIYLEDAVKHGARVRKAGDCADYIECLRTFLRRDLLNWEEMLRVCSAPQKSVTAIASSDEFLRFAAFLSEQSCGSVGLSDAYYGLKSMFLPLMYLLQQSVPEADIYHSAVAGYGGLLGAMAKFKTGKPFVLTEHGIYPREREEELMQADWFAPSMRRFWILSFYNLSRCAYHFADKVTALFADASEKQKEIGCDPEKCTVVGNGIHLSRFEDIPVRSGGDMVNIGAFVRFAPIKDVKTLIYSFYDLQKKRENVRLYILGGTDDETYRDECLNLIDRLGVRHVHADGHVDPVEYMAKMDFTVMTSISEGQPLAVLESFAAARPCVCTNVGNCAELLNDPSDGFGEAGICCSPMDITALAQAMEKLCADPELRKTMGENGRARVRAGFTHEIMKNRYFDVYKEVMS